LTGTVFEWYVRGMKVKTSVKVRTYLQILRRKRRDQQDLRMINRLSEKLNREAEDVLGYQRELRLPAG